MTLGNIIKTTHFVSNITDWFQTYFKNNFQYITTNI